MKLSLSTHLFIFLRSVFRVSSFELVVSGLARSKTETTKSHEDTLTKKGTNSRVMIRFCSRLFRVVSCKFVAPAFNGVGAPTLSSRKQVVSWALAAAIVLAQSGQLTASPRLLVSASHQLAWQNSRRKNLNHPKDPGTLPTSV